MANAELASAGVLRWHFHRSGAANHPICGAQVTTERLAAEVRRCEVHRASVDGRSNRGVRPNVLRNRSAMGNRHTPQKFFNSRGIGQLQQGQSSVP